MICAKCEHLTYRVTVGTAVILLPMVFLTKLIELWCGKILRWWSWDTSAFMIQLPGIQETMRSHYSHGHVSKTIGAMHG